VDAGTSILPESLEAYLGASTTRTDSAPDMAPWDMGYHYPEHLLVGVEEPVSGPAWFPAVRTLPNPFTSRVLFKRATGQAGTIDVFDALGRQVQHLEFGAGQTRLVWDTRNLKPGSYFYRLRSGARALTGRLTRI
jgi:hypothetical protein